jgi:hypothetical protein
VFLGSGVPNGGAALTNACIFSPVAQVGVIDMSGAFRNMGVTGPYYTNYGAIAPFMTQGYVQDVYGDLAHTFNAITPRRLSIQMQRYSVPAALTPVGAAQAIVVTGYTKVIVTPAAAASITTATFSQNPGTGDDYLRNGDLYIECGNGNLTINHSASGNFTFRFKSGSTPPAYAAGAVIHFHWSSTSNQWIEV